MYTLFFALGRFLKAFCASWCAFGRSWLFLVRLGTLRVRFSRGGWERRPWFWRSKTTILACFCTHTWQHCANPPTLTKLWQGQQKPWFFTDACPADVLFPQWRLCFCIPYSCSVFLFGAAVCAQHMEYKNRPPIDEDHATLEPLWSLMLAFWSAHLRSCSLS